MMEFPSSKLISHLWRFHQARGVYIAVFRMNLPLLLVVSSKKLGINRKK